jgi:hypothetical protein
MPVAVPTPSALKGKKLNIFVNDDRSTVTLFSPENNFATYVDFNIGEGLGINLDASAATEAKTETLTLEMQTQTILSTGRCRY